MTNQEILNMSDALEKVNKLSGIKFAYAMAKNINLVKSEIETFRETLKPTNEFNEYENKRIELAKKYAKKDEKGVPMIKGNEYDVEDRDAFEKEYEELKAENKEIIDAREKQVKDFESFLKEESKLSLHKIKSVDIPENITTEQLSGIMSLVED